MALLDLLGRRMTFAFCGSCAISASPSAALQEAAETNPSVLNARLAELRSARLVEHGADGYGLTPDGASLLATFLPLNAWAEQWAATLAPKARAEESRQARNRQRSRVPCGRQARPGPRSCPVASRRSIICE